MADSMAGRPAGDPTPITAGPARVSGEPGGAALLAMLLLLGLALALVLWRHSPSPPLPADAPAAEFSAGRARAVLHDLVGDGRPHPVGSVAASAVRQRILAVLGGLGYQPHVEDGFACHWSGACAHVRNVVARLDGREPGPAVAVAAHYDSVPAGPGAGDDGAGTAAVLEIARALRQGPPPRHPVYLLLDEGEEAGLVGAAAFEESSPEAKEVRAVVNMDARGTSGPSYMFETSGADGWLIDAWAPRAVRPVTTSLAAFIYTQLPNDTDLTVFRQHGVAGLNFAFIGNAARYHTAADSFANASPATLQHQGENALAALRGLADSPDLAAPPAGRLVYFDVAGLGIVRWPIGWTVVLAALALAGVVAVAIAGWRRRTIAGADLALGFLLVPVTALLAALAGYGLELVLAAAGPLHVIWLTQPLAGHLVFWFLALAVVGGLALMMGQRCGVFGLWSGIWLAWAAAGLVAALTAPAVSYIFVAPALVAAVAAALGRVWRGRGAVAVVIVPALVAALLWFGVAPAIYEGLGVPALPIVGILVAICLSSVTPLIPGGGFAGRRLWLMGLVGAGSGVVLLAAAPHYTPANPESLSLAYALEAGGSAGQWLVWGAPQLPDGVARAAAFGEPGPPFPWSPPYARARLAAAPRLDLPAPELRVLADAVSGGKRHLRLHLLTHRGATSAAVYLPASAQPETVLLEGHDALHAGIHKGTAAGAAAAAAGERRYIQVFDETLPPAGADLEVVLGRTGPQDWYVSDGSHGLPPAAAALLAARPAYALPQHQGDATYVWRRVRI